MAADNPSTWSVRNGVGAQASAQITVDASGYTTPQMAVRTNGGPVEVGNPLPTSDTNSAAALAQSELSATALGTPADAAWGGSGSSSIVGALKAIWTALTGILSVRPVPTGLGALTAVPSGTTNGTVLGSPPTNSQGARLYLPAGASVTFTVASSQPSSAPAATFTTPVGTIAGNWDERLAGGQMIYVTAVVGSPLFRWI